MAETREVKVPDIGGFDAVDVVEILVAPGDAVEVETPLITLESDKASMDVPSPLAGKVLEVKVGVGDKIAEGAVILLLAVEEASAEPEETPRPEAAPVQEPEPEAPAPRPAAAAPPPSPTPDPESGADEEPFNRAYASPAVRRLARELGVDLSAVRGTGRKGRILKEDVQSFVKGALKQGPATVSAAVGGGVEGAFHLPPMPEIDFSRFGATERVPLSRIRKVSAANLHRSWLHVPHVTQHDEADITEMEAFRQSLKEEAAAAGVKLTPVAFLIKAAVAALREFPDVNASLAPGGEALIRKRYYHIGIAVDTADGLVVPAVRDADRKSLFELARDLAEISGRAREGKLKMDDIQGASFTISSLGSIGGTAFTPIVNAPEVAILGVSRARMKPVWQDGEFVPRLMLPLSLSYDHRVIDGAMAVRFTAWLARVLGDIRRLLL